MRCLTADLITLLTRGNEAGRVRKIRIAGIIGLAVLIAAAAVSFLPAGAEGNAQQYEKITTYIADLESGIANDDNNWDLLFDAYISGGKITGNCGSESGFYGAGFRHKTSGRGIAAISANISIPEGRKGFVQFGLRLDDYMCSGGEKKGLFICVNASGQLGLLNVSGKKVNAKDTGYSFTEGRQVYIEDNASDNVITVYFDNGGQKVKVAECVIAESTATLRFEDDSIAPVEVKYGQTIYRDGYVSVTSQAAGANISALSVSLPSYSSEPYAAAEETVVGGAKANANAGQGESAESSDDTAQKKSVVNSDFILYLIISAVMLAVIVFVSIVLARTKKKE